MTNLVIGIYNYLLHHRMVGMVSFVAVTAALLFLMLRLQYKENIADFLPLDAQHQNAATKRNLAYIKTFLAQTRL